MKQYKVIRIDMEAYKNFTDKQEKMNKIYKRITGKTKRIPMVKVINISSASPIFYMGENSLLKQMRKKL